MRWRIRLYKTTTSHGLMAHWRTGGSLFTQWFSSTAKINACTFMAMFCEHGLYGTDY